MAPLETVKMAFAALSANKLRSSLTILGIVVGVFSVIGVMTFISGMQASIESGLNILGANSFQIQRFPAINFSNPWVRYGNRPHITYQQAERFQRLMRGQAGVSLRINRNHRTVTYFDRRTNPNVVLVGTDENFVTAFNYDVAAGRNLGPGDVSFGRPVCVLGYDVAQQLFPGENANGRLIRVEGQNYTVVGVLAPKGTSFGQTQDNFVITPITRWLAVYGRSRRSIDINVQAPGPAALPEVMDRAIGAMRLVRGLGPEDSNDFEVFTNASLVEMFDRVTDVVAAGAFVISAIALVAAGVGVMNIMLVSVTERTREIGVRKSIGARKKSILAQFLLEAVVLSLAGGVAGVLLGVAGGNVAALLMHTTISFPWPWAAAGLAVCSGIGVLFGFYPAWKAASLDPIEALRHE